MERYIKTIQYKGRDGKRCWFTVEPMKFAMMSVSDARLQERGTN